MIDALISGRLVKDPQTRIGQSGKPFTTALLRVATGDEEQTLVSVIAFQEQAEKLGRLKSGDSVSVAGSAKLTEWVKGGETKHGLSVTASAILSAYDVKKRRGSTDTTTAPPQRAANGDFDDRMEF
jgi:single-stranded DNA-binding protein